MSCIICRSGYRKNNVSKTRVLVLPLQQVHVNGTHAGNHKKIFGMTLKRYFEIICHNAYNMHADKPIKCTGLLMHLLCKSIH